MVQLLLSSREKENRPMPQSRNIARIARGLVRGIVLGSVALFPSLPAFGQATDSLSLDQVIRDVIRNNNRVAAARYMEVAAEAKVGPAGAWDDPMLMLGVANLPTSFDFSMDPMTMKMVGLSQNIPYAGQKGLQAKAAQAEAKAAGEDRRAMEVDLVLAARFAFADLFYRSRALEDMTSQNELLEDVVDAVTAKLAVDQTGQDEVLGAQAEQWRLQTQLLEAQQMVDESRYSLNILRGLDVTAPARPLATPTAVEPPPTPDAWLAAARQNYPPLQKLFRQSEAYGYSSIAAGRMSWPMLGLSANYAFRSSAEMEKRDNMIGFQANISLPFFAGRQQKQMAASMNAMRKGVDDEAVQKWREVEARLRLLHTTALNLKQTMAIYRDRIIPAAEDAFRSALSGYSSNRVPYTNVLMFATGIYRDRLALNQVANQFARTMAEIESYTIDPGSYAAIPTEGNQ
jgi:cobalt-zinc-cadmium efflux system outer membrane protein